MVVAEETKTDVSAAAGEVQAGQTAGQTSGAAQTSVDTISAESGVTGGAGAKEGEGTETKVEGEVSENNQTQKQESSKEQQTIARFQAEKDRAEAQVKNLYKQFMPYFDFDPQTGNVVGLKNQQGQPVGKPDPAGTAAKEMDGLMEAALISGDTNALKQIIAQVKDEVKREAREEGVREIQNVSAIEKEVGNLRKDYPNLYDENGQPKNDDPLFQETAKVIEEIQSVFPNIAHPLYVRHAIEKAELRLLKKGMPAMQQQIKNDAQTKLKGISSSAAAQSGAGKSDEVSGASVFSSSQIAQLKREGEDEAGINRMAKIFQQAAKEAGKEGGLML